MRCVDFVGQFLELAVVSSSGAFEDGSFDVVRRHVGRFTLQQNHTKTGVHVRVASAISRGDRDLPRQFREDFPAFGVDCALKCLNF